MTLPLYEKEAYRIEEVVQRIKGLTDELGYEGFSQTTIFCALHYTELVFEYILKKWVQNMPEHEKPEWLKGPDEYVNSVRLVAERKLDLETYVE